MAAPIRQRIDRAWRELLGYPGPKRGRRETFLGATANRLYDNWRATTAQVDAEVRARGRLLRARARDLNTNDEYVGNFRRLLVNNVLGHRGFELQPMVKTAAGALDMATNRRIAAAWGEWETERVTTDGQHTWHSLCKLVLVTSRIEGECFIRVIRGGPFNTWGLAFETIDADLIDETMNRSGFRKADGTWSNEVRMGIEVDQFGRRVGYHVWERPRSVYEEASRLRYFVPNSEMIHLMDPLRFHQTRGFSALNPVMLTTHRRNNMDEAEEVATIVGASKMGIIQSKDTAQLGETVTQNKIEVDTEPGTWLQLDPGWEANTWDPDHPNPNLWQFMKYLLRRVASGLGVGYNAMASDFEGVTWTSLRQSNLTDRDEWRQLQRWFTDFFLVAVYPHWLEATLYSGKLSLESFDVRRYLAAHWQPRGWESVQPLDDIQADERKIALGLTTRTQLAAERGGNFERNLQRLAEENRLAEEAGVDVSGVLEPPTPSQPDPPDSAAKAAEGAAGSNGKKKSLRALAREGGRF